MAEIKIIGDGRESDAAGQYIQAIGKKLVVIRGRAGTGKTIKLVHIAYDLCKRRGKRCLILTYNRALVSDLRRTIALANIKSDLDDGAVQVETIHAFMRKVLIAFKLHSKAEDALYLKKYEALKDELLSCLRESAITPEDVAQAKENDDELVWDKLLIDEGQDWPDNERDILFKGPDKTCSHP